MPATSHSPSHRVVLTGASGTLGGHFLRLAAQRPDIHILALIREQSRPLPPGPRMESVKIHFDDTHAIQETIRNYAPTALVHCAAAGMDFPRPLWFDLIRFNVNTTITLCEAASQTPGCQFIFISTGLVYKRQNRPLTETDPLDTLHPYGASKAAADLLVRSAAAEFRVPLTVLRPFSFTGPGDDKNRLFPSLLRAAASRQPFPLSPGGQLRDHCSARDIAQAILAAILNPAPPKTSRIFNLGSGQPTPLRELILQVTSQLHLDTPLHFGALPYGPHEPMHFIADTLHARTHLPWTPRHNLAHAVWQLAKTSFPTLHLHEPPENLPSEPTETPPPPSVNSAF